MTTVEALSEPIVAALTTALKSLFENALQHPEAPWDELLEGVGQALRPVVCQAAEAVVQAGCRYQAAPNCPHCDRRLQSKGTERYQVLDLLGELKLPVRRWHCPDCGHTARPALEAAGLRRHCTRRLTDTALRLASYLPYRTAETVLASFGIRLSDNTLRRMVGEVGGERVEERAREAQAVEQLELQLPAERQAPRAYQLIDGCMARVRGAPKGWREVRLVVHFGTAAVGRNERGQPPPPQWLAASASLLRDPEDPCQAASLMRLVYAQAERCGQQTAGELVLLQDGADWIWQRATAQVPLGVRSVEILDFWHAAQRLSEGLKAALGPETPRYQATFDRLRGWLRAGDSAAVRQELATLELQLSGPAAKAVGDARRYLKKHRRRMDYRRLELAGYHIGSGTVESWCKLILRRVKGPGMRWSEPGLEAMLALQTHYLTEDWSPGRRFEAA